MPKLPVTPDARSRNLRQFNQDSAAAFKVGAAVVLAADEEIEECGADPALIRGFAATAAGLDPESATKCLVACCDQGEKFWITGDNDPVAGDVNQSYGITEDADGIWHLDGTKTAGDARLYVHAVDIDRKSYLVSVLEANRQAAA